MIPKLRRDQPRRSAQGLEYELGEFVTFTPEELKALDVGSSRAIDLNTFLPPAEVDPLYFHALLRVPRRRGCG